MATRSFDAILSDPKRIECVDTCVGNEPKRKKKKKRGKEKMKMSLYCLADGCGARICWMPLSPCRPIDVAHITNGMYALSQTH